MLYSSPVLGGELHLAKETGTSWGVQSHRISAFGSKELIYLGCLLFEGKGIQNSFDFPRAGWLKAEHNDLPFTQKTNH